MIKNPVKKHNGLQITTFYFTRVPNGYEVNNF